MPLGVNRFGSPEDLPYPIPFHRITVEYRDPQLSPHDRPMRAEVKMVAGKPLFEGGPSLPEPVVTNLWGPDPRVWPKPDGDTCPYHDSAPMNRFRRWGLVEYGRPACEQCVYRWLLRGEAEILGIDAFRQFAASIDRSVNDDGYHMVDALIEAHDLRGSVVVDECVRGIEAVVRLGGETLDRLVVALEAAGLRR